MAIHLNLNNVMENNDINDTRLHCMPCVIKSNGDAKVSEYFEPIISENKNGVLEASFRGRPLLGKEVIVPTNYTGVVLQGASNILSEETDRNLYGIHMFNKFIYWNLDVEPSETDKIKMALEWLDVAEALHAPVDS